MVSIEGKRCLQVFSGLLAALTVLFSQPLMAEQKATLGNWEVHYMALNSTFLSPDIATHYGIVRSKYNGVINISVLDQHTLKAQPVLLTGVATNLLGVAKTLEFKEVHEGEAIYYLAVLGFRDQERYRINLTISDGKSQQTLKFEHKFYAE